MTSKVVLFSSAKDDFAKLPQKIRERVAESINDLEDFPINKRGILKLKPPFEGYRKRVGNHRVLFDYVDDTVLIRRIMDRKDAYR